MIKIGMLIADRYEILEKVGTGGMADVYKAKDHTLNRLVAVKVLKQEFSENANFVSKFRVEAQAAAGLSHPNIVNVYDVGEEKGMYYIVMELVDGITLKEYIEKKGHLSYKEAVTIAIQVSLGLEAAHRNHIIHRDIKPQNIIISRDGKVKVTDFGIAKAATSDTITSNVMGSVHYTSPEQARGGYSDERSDVYSLGITLFEMLTGHVPFDGDTTVAIAIRHIQDPMPSPREYIGNLPYSVEQIVLKCCEKSPDRRYQNMRELSDDLKHCLADPEGDFVQRYDPDKMDQTRMISEEERRQVRELANERAEAAAAGTVSAAAAGQLKRTGEDPENGRAVQSYSAESNNGSEPAQRGNRKGKTYSDRTGDVESSSRASDDRKDSGENDEEEILRTGRTDNHHRDDLYEEDAKEEVDRLEKTTRILAILAVLIIAVIILLIIAGRTGLLSVGRGQNASNAESTEMVIMPVVVGQDVDAARKALVEKGLVPEITYEESDDYNEGIVMDASVKEGTQVAVGTTVTLTVCSTGSQIEVPSVVGKSSEEAQNILSEQGFSVIVNQDSSEDVDEGDVISQNPDAGTEAEKGSTVTIVVSTGPDTSNQVQMPDLIGMTEQEARATLNALGLKAGNVRTVVTDDTSNAGLVISQDVEEGETLEKGTAVNFNIGGRQTYSYSADISAPTYSEDSDYQSGTSVHITITTADGQQLLDTTTSAFPYRVSYTGISSSSGTLTMTYTNTISETVEVQNGSDESQDSDQETDDDGQDSGSSNEDSGTGTTVVTHTEDKTVTRQLSFTPEN